MTVRVITPPSVEPVTLAQARLWCRIDDDDTSQDAVLTMLIQAMREYAENLTNRAFVQRTLELSLPCFPGYAGFAAERCASDTIVLPYAPLVSVTSVKYIDLSGTLQTVDPANYQVDTAGEPGRIKPAYLLTWYVTRNDFNAVQIRYEAGYAPSSSPTDYRENVPASVKLWMQARLSTLYENREQLINSNMVAIPRDFADGLLDSLIVGTRLMG